MPGKRWIPEEKRRKIAEDYHRLNSYRAAAVLNEVAPNTVKNIMKEAGCSLSEIAGAENRQPRASKVRQEDNTVVPAQEPAPKVGAKEEYRDESRQAFEEVTDEREEIRRLLRLLLRRMGDPEAVLELNAYQAARVYAMLCDRMGGQEGQKTVRISFGSVTGEDLSLLAK